MLTDAARFTALCLTLLAGALLAACSGDDPGGGTEPVPEEEIQALLDRSFTASTEDDCVEIYTERAVEQVAQTDGDPVVECEENYDPESDADSIEVSDLAVDGASATVTVASEGGVLDGTNVSLALVDDEGWKIDQIDDIVIEDRTAFTKAADEALQEFEGAEVTKKQSGCIKRYITEDVTDEELERAILEGDNGFGFDAIRLCIGGGSDLVAITFIVEGQLQAEGIPKDIATCIAGSGVAGLKGATLEDLATDEEIKQRYDDAIQEGAQICAGG